MAQTPPPNITPTPTPAIQRGDRATFSSRVDAFITWLVTAVGQFGAVATNVYNNAVDAWNSAISAKADATAAAASAITALSAANVSRWVSGTTYQQDQVAISPNDGTTYRRKTAAGVSTVDPSADPTNWAPLVARGTPRILVVTMTQPWTVPAAEFEVELQGAGGGGGSGGTRGGGAGGYVRKRFSGAVVGSSAMITLGAKGSGQPAGGGGAPTDAQSASFVLSGFTTLSAGGGKAGGAGASDGSGGVATGGDINIPGQRGVVGGVDDTAANINGARGGDSMLGRSNTDERGPGPTTSGYGSGGASGGKVYPGPTWYAGAAGGDAICIIRW